MSSVRGLEPGKRAALLVVEVQNGITNPSYDDTPLARQVVARGIVAGINTLATAFREVGAPVIFCTIAAATSDWKGFRVNCALAARIRRKGKLVNGTEHAAIHDDLIVAPSDIVSHRDRDYADLLADLGELPALAAGPNRRRDRFARSRAVPRLPGERTGR